MSTREYEVRGFGIELKTSFKNDYDLEKFKELLKTAPILKSKIIKIFEEWDVDFEYATKVEFSEYVEICCEKIGVDIAYLVAEIINENIGENIFEALKCEEDGSVYIYINRLLPWEMTDYERTLTPEKVEEVINEYYKVVFNDYAVPSDVSIRIFS